MRRAAEVAFGSLSSYRLGLESYDQDKIGLGLLCAQMTGAGNEDKFAGPLPIGVVRPMEFSTAIPGIYPWAMQWSNSASAQEDWLFLADNATAAATRRIMLATLNRLTGSFSVAGFITCTFPPATNHTIRALRMTYDKHTAGTVSISGTAVTGSSTTWQTDRACVGNRIGFGSTDPTQISTWYEISAIGSNTSITLATSAGTVAGGTAYVIEDLRAVIATTNATATNGGLFVVKGLRKEAFSAGGTNIPAAVSTDNIRAVYWLKDAATVTNTTANGMAVEASGTFASRMVWVGNGTTTQQLFKYNIRAALTLTSGADTTNFQFATAVSATLAGTATQTNNGRAATASHGPGSGSECYYFTTSSRVYRTKALSTVTTGDTTFITGGDVMTEIPPGGVNSTAASGGMSAIEYAGMIDKFIITTNATNRSYVTAYNASGSQLDRLFGVDTRQIDQGSADSSTTPHPTMTGGAFSLWSEGGMLYIATVGTTAITNRVYAVPLAADWEYTTSPNGVIITPRIACPDVDKFVRAWINLAEVIGGATGKNLGMAPEPVRVKYRTAGISDNSGGWTQLDQTLTMAGVAGAAYVQFQLEFRMIGVMCIAPRVFNVGVTYDDLSTLAQYQFSASKSDAANKRFAWRFATAFGSSVPALRVRLYDAVTGSNLVDDDTASPTGTFEKSTDGTSFVAWTNADKGNETTYLRYTPASLADDVSVRAVLTLN